jgi:hypothetical protein
MVVTGRLCGRRVRLIASVVGSLHRGQRRDGEDADGDPEQDDDDGSDRTEPRPAGITGVAADR